MLGRRRAGCGESCPGPSTGDDGRGIWDYSRWQATRGRRVVARMAQQASQPMIPRLWSAISASDAYERLVSENVELAQKIHKSRGMRLKGEEGATPEAVEQHGRHGGL